MPNAIRRMPLGSVALSGAIAIIALALTPFLDATPNASDAGTAIHVAPAGGRWCALQDAGTKDCRYQTFDQCFRATIGAYGPCRPNPAAFVITDEIPYRTYHSLSRIENGATTIK